jgi:putative membrane protein (TIGR04086 family)
MKQNAIYLLKGLLFSSLILTLVILLLALLLMKTGWADTVIFPLLLVFFGIATLVGARYYAKHTTSKRFLWGILFGAAFFSLYLVVSALTAGNDTLISENAMFFFLTSLVSGCIGGMSALS